jgi:hypothetical protein
MYLVDVTVFKQIRDFARFFKVVEINLQFSKTSLTTQCSSPDSAVLFEARIDKKLFKDYDVEKDISVNIHISELSIYDDVYMPVYITILDSGELSFCFKNFTRTGWNLTENPKTTKGDRFDTPEPSTGGYTIGVHDFNMILRTICANGKHTTITKTPFHLEFSSGSTKLTVAFSGAEFSPQKFDSFLLSRLKYFPDNVVSVNMTIEDGKPIVFETLTRYDNLVLWRVFIAPVL